MPPTKPQLENLASMVAEIGVENVVEMAIKSAAGLPMDKYTVTGDTGRALLNRVRAEVSSTADYLEKEKREGN